MAPVTFVRNFTDFEGELVWICTDKEKPMTTDFSEQGATVVPSSVSQH